SRSARPSSPSTPGQPAGPTPPTPLTAPPPSAPLHYSSPERPLHHDQVDLSSLTHGLARGLPRFVRAETRISQLHPGDGRAGEKTYLLRRLCRIAPVCFPVSG